MSLLPGTGPTAPEGIEGGQATPDPRYRAVRQSGPSTGTAAARSRLRPEEALFLVFGLVVAAVAATAGVARSPSGRC